METLLPGGINITSDEFQCLANDLYDIEWWIRLAVKGKINNCKKRLINEWTQRLRADPAIAQIPANEAELLSMIFSHPEYQNRTERELVTEE